MYSFRFFPFLTNFEIRTLKNYNNKTNLDSAVFAYTHTTHVRRAAIFSFFSPSSFLHSLTSHTTAEVTSSVPKVNFPKASAQNFWEKKEEKRVFQLAT